MWWNLICDVSVAVAPERDMDTSLRIRNMFSRAIIAWEYGIQCVIGIPDATGIINTGDMITVNGYPGIIVIQKADAL